MHTEEDHFPSLQELLAGGPPEGSVPEAFRKSYMERLADSDGTLDSLVSILEECAKEQWERDTAKLADHFDTGTLPD